MSRINLIYILFICIGCEQNEIAIEKHPIGEIETIQINMESNYSKQIFFNINDKIDLKINGDKPRDICRYISLAVKKISKKIVKLKPDLIILLGDRYEIFSAGIVALIHQIPICHQEHHSRT